jgi:O-antigen/teichoic acid export membrane protein
MSSQLWSKRLLKKVPLAVVASSMPGLVNYVSVILLVYQFSTADAGLYRTLVAYLGLIGLLSLQETSKILIRATVQSDIPSIKRLLLSRALFTLIAAGFIGITYFASGRLGFDFPFVIVIVALIAALQFPAESYKAVWQANGRFGLLVVSETLRYGSGLGVFVVLVWRGVPVETATLVQLFVVALITAGTGIAVFGRLFRGRLWSGWSGSFRSADVMEARLLSLAGVLPGSLEHVDKLLIGHFLGLEALGIYTLGFSTGRLVYNALKPAIYVFYARFVDHMPRDRDLWIVFLVFSLAGLALTLLYIGVIQAIPALSRFRGTELVASIIFLAYGIAMVDAVYTQAFSINSATKSGHVLTANVLAALACFPLFAVAALASAQLALALFAFHYPARHALTFLFLRLRAGTIAPA